VAYSLHSLGSVPGLPFAAGIAQEEIEIIQRMIDQGINTPLTSSCGRLFDAVSALLDVCLEASYEAQAAIELENLAGDLQRSDTAYPFSIDDQGSQQILRLEGLLRAIVDAILAKRPVQEISARFHNTVAEMILQMCLRLRAYGGWNTAALSGGCFQNRQLLHLTKEALEEAGFRILLHSQVPCNDGGLALGQAVIAHFLLGGHV
jgi:hydrogenase maturation protein HypF